MKGLLKFCLLVAALYGIYCVRDMMIRSDINNQALPFVKETVEATTTGWNRSIVDKAADPALAAQVANMQAIGNRHIMDFSFYARLGARSSQAECKLDDYNKLKDDTRDFISANYECAVQYERASATVLMTVLRSKQNEPWSIVYFDVLSPYLSSIAAQEEKH